MAAQADKVTGSKPDRRQRNDGAAMRPLKTRPTSDSDLIKRCADEHRKTLRKLAKR